MSGAEFGPDWYVGPRQRNASHWSHLSPDPNASAVVEHLRQQLATAYSGRIADTDRFLLDFVRDKTVLDVGAVQHVAERADRPRWKHRRIVDVARRVVGIDIADAEAQRLRKQGFDIRTVDATSEADLGERFERVVVGDVIEHVNDPVALLRFGKRHLTGDGAMLVVTPNPLFVTYLVRSLRQGVFIPNADHVRWVSPSMALELAARADLTLDGYYHTQGDGSTPLTRTAVHLLRLLRRRDAELFTAHFYYVFGRRR